MRHCSFAEYIRCGVPQGDPLSMLLFCIGINPFLLKLTENGFKHVAYADDINIGLKDSDNLTDFIKFADEEYGKMGLTINKDKCGFTGNKDEEVKIMG